MARIRTVKPEFFRHEGLSELEVQYPKLRPMLVFEGLWCQCAKNGVFLWRVKQMALDILPFVLGSSGELLGKCMEILLEKGYLKRGKVGDTVYGYIPTFVEHQRFSGKENQEPPKFPDSKKIAFEAVPGNVPGSSRDVTGKQLGTQERSKEEGYTEEGYIPPTPLTPRKRVERTSERFDAFWAEYPRKAAKEAARKAFKKRGLDSQIANVLAKLRADKATEQWQEERFIPLPATWINREDFSEAVPIPSAQGETAPGTARALTPDERYEQEKAEKEKRFAWDRDAKAYGTPELVGQYPWLKKEAQHGTA